MILPRLKEGYLIRLDVQFFPFDFCNGGTNLMYNKDLAWSQNSTLKSRIQDEQTGKQSEKTCRRHQLETVVKVRRNASLMFPGNYFIYADKTTYQQNLTYLHNTFKNINPGKPTAGINLWNQGFFTFLKNVRNKSRDFLEFQGFFFNFRIIKKWYYLYSLLLVYLLVFYFRSFKHFS